MKADRQKTAATAVDHHHDALQVSRLSAALKERRHVWCPVRDLTRCMRESLREECWQFENKGRTSDGQRSSFRNLGDLSYVASMQNRLALTQPVFMNQECGAAFSYSQKTKGRRTGCHIRRYNTQHSSSAKNVHACTRRLHCRREVLVEYCNCQAEECGKNLKNGQVSVRKTHRPAPTTYWLAMRNPNVFVPANHKLELQPTKYMCNRKALAGYTCRVVEVLVPTEGIPVMNALRMTQNTLGELKVDAVDTASFHKRGRRQRDASVANLASSSVTFERTAWIPTAVYRIHRNFLPLGSNLKFVHVEGNERHRNVN
ncbi:hypothetical protein BKA93DRAFT_882383 [Sparassis latifolia]